MSVIVVEFVSAEAMREAGGGRLPSPAQIIRLAGHDPALCDLEEVDYGRGWRVVQRGVYCDDHFESHEFASSEEVAPTDTGLDGVVPLPKERWQVPVPISDAEWAEQNRRANALLMGRAE